ncbi:MULTISPECIES: CAP domain-containing protein [Micromonospora]|uniref:CAP domain-containing protein n=1 Tax=Micromonospora TaxID=1873 RepID=UPI0027DCDE81|nr:MULTISPECIES: CAP domain-containing protein [Micromonospora]WSK44409.1 CAP domain-containing protein [Micromonospora maris]
MHGWNDPLDPDATRRPAPPTDDDPAWLTDRPAPRSSYLFGDEPESSSDRWYHDQPTEQWHRPHRPAEAGYPAPAHPHWADQNSADQNSADQGGVGQHHRDTAWPSEGHHGAPSHGRHDGDWRADEPTTQVSRWSDQHDGQQPARHAAPDPHHDNQGYDNQGYADSQLPYAAQDPYLVQPYGEQPYGEQSYRDQHYGAQLPYSDQQPYAGQQQYGRGDERQWHGERSYGVPEDRASARTETVADAPETDARPSRRRLSRPLVLGGAAAAATLAVSIGVAALALPGNDAPTSTTAGERPVATGPALLESEEPVDVLDPLDSPSPSPSPSVSPSAATPSPSPSLAAKPKPTPARSSTAPSRQSAERRGSPSRGATVTASPSNGAGGSQAAQVVDLVNAERAKAGCGALTVDEKLTTAAQRHSQDQADNRNMSHTGSDGSDPGERIDRVGYAWRTYGENVAWNQQSPAAVMDAWMNSPGHRANILNCAFTEIGVGVASSNGPYWTQVFAAPR